MVSSNTVTPNVEMLSGAERALMRLKASPAKSLVGLVDGDGAEVVLNHFFPESAQNPKFDYRFASFKDKAGNPNEGNVRRKQLRGWELVKRESLDNRVPYDKEALTLFDDGTGLIMSGAQVLMRRPKTVSDKIHAASSAAVRSRRDHAAKVGKTVEAAGRFIAANPSATLGKDFNDQQEELLALSGSLDVQDAEDKKREG